MKRFLEILGAISISAATTAVSISCATENSAPKIISIEYSESDQIISISFSNSSRIPKTIEKDKVHLWKISDSNKYEVDFINAFVDDGVVKIQCSENLAGPEFNEYEISIFGLDTTKNNTFSTIGKNSKISNISYNYDELSPIVNVTFNEKYTFPIVDLNNVSIKSGSNGAVVKIKDLKIDRVNFNVGIVLNEGLQRDDETRYDIEFLGNHVEGNYSFYVKGSQAVMSEASYDNSGLNGDPKTIYIVLRNAAKVIGKVKKEDISLIAGGNTDVSQNIDSFVIADSTYQLRIHLKEPLKPNKDTSYVVSVKGILKENSTAGEFMVRGCQPQITKVEYTKSFYPMTTNNGDSGRPAIYVYAGIFNYNYQGHHNIAAADVKILDSEGKDFSSLVKDGWLNEWPLQERNVVVLNDQLPKGTYVITISWFSSNDNNTFIVD